MGNILYKIGATFFRIYFKLAHNWKIHGKSNRVNSGPLIIISNHVSYFDPPLVGSIMKRQVHFLAKKELFKNNIFGWVLRKIGVIPIKRGKPDRKAIKNAFNVLKNKKVLGIFPEGTRHHPEKLGKAKAGVVMIALKSECPILPVGIKYITDNNKNTQVSIGKPFTLDEFYNKKLNRDEKKEVGNLLMDKIKNELDKIK